MTIVLTAPTIDQLWEAFVATRSTEDRNNLVRHYTPIVKLAAGRVMAQTPPWEEYDDLLEYGFIGLIEALDRFDATRQSDRTLAEQFEAFAGNRIRGAILDALRKQDWVPKDHRARMNSVLGARDELKASGAAVTDETTANYLGLTITEVRDTRSAAYTAKAFLPVHTAAAIPHDPASDPAADTGIDLEPLIDHLDHAVSQLSERDRALLTLYYIEGLTLTEIADLMGGTRASYISTLKSAALADVRRIAIAGA